MENEICIILCSLQSLFNIFVILNAGCNTLYTVPKPIEIDKEIIDKVTIYYANSVLLWYLALNR